MHELNKSESELIKKNISSIYEDVLIRYDASKYPEKSYDEARIQFSVRDEENSQIENAMKWKWGHWGKNNFPQHHKNLIETINKIWPKYVKSRCIAPKDTFNYWKESLGNQDRYISVAFITHLIHSDSVPIIDQHSYRAMNHLLRVSGRKIENKKKPSTWGDIQDLNVFLSSISRSLGKGTREVDKFLMMYGRYCVPR